MEPVILEKKLRLHGDGVLRITYGLVEVNHTVQHLGGANPLVDSAAALLVVNRIVVVAFERSDSATEDADALLVGLTDNLFVDVDDTLGRLYTVLCTAQVIDSLEEDNPLYALLSEKVALITARSRRTKTSSKYAVSTDTHVEHAHLACRLIG